MSTFRVQEPTHSRVPILLSVPHCGTAFPNEIINEFRADLIASPDDTDWNVDRLYDFAGDMGITLIAARYSRWVIDLNRDPANKPLYADGRIITGLCPLTNFLGDSLYADGRTSIDAQEVSRRLDRYYWPYHQKLAELLSSLKTEFGKVLLWECHSIRQFVGTIHQEKLPDLILGDVAGTSASPLLTQVALQSLQASDYKVQHNFLFQGGYLTRHFGNPGENQHALQLEMTKVNYMDDAESTYAPERAARMRRLLRDTLGAVARSMEEIE